MTEKCINDGRTALVRHLDKGWMCVECAAREGNTTAIYLEAQRAVEQMLDDIVGKCKTIQAGGIQ